MGKYFLSFITNPLRVVKKLSRSEIPLHLRFSGERCHWVGFQPKTANPQFFALDESGASSAEGVKNLTSPRNLKSFDVIANEVRGKGKNKPVPVVNGAVSRSYTVFVPASFRRGITQRLNDFVWLDDLCLPRHRSSR